MKIVKHRWSKLVEQRLNKVLGDDLEFLKSQVQNNEAEVFSFTCQDVDLFVLTRIEKKELVVCCMQGIGLNKVVPILRKTAIFGGCETARFHTVRALNRMKELKDAELIESIYKIELI